MPSRWEIQVTAPASPAIPLTAPHALISGWLDDPPPDRIRGAAHTTARSGHYDQARKWAAGPLRTLTAATGDAHDALALQVRLLDDGLADRLLAAARAGTQVRLGADHCHITQPPRLIEQIPWSDVLHWSGARSWQVRFITPACFRRGNRTSPWPAPETLTRGLAARWERLHPDTAHKLPAPGRDPVWVSDIDGRSEVQTLTRNVRRATGWILEDEIVSGFTDRMRYACDQRTTGQAATFDALMAFAAYAAGNSCGYCVRCE